VQKPLAACQGKTVPGAVLLVAAGRSVPGGPPQKILEADGGGQAAPDPGYRGWRCKISAGLESEGRHLVLLVTDAQREVVQGAANDSVGTAVQQLKQRYMAVQPHEHCRCADQVVGKLRWQLAGRGDGFVSSGRVFGSTQCLRKLLKKSLGTLKIGQIK
jgi:hypothetical protein